MVKNSMSSKAMGCPMCKVPIEWEETDKSNVLRGTCPKCGMGFTNMNGTIVSDPKFSKKT